MAVYVDDMAASFGRMKMCHMLADSDEELHEMADKIGVQRKWWQSPSKTSGSHYDIARSKRALAVKNGAIEITLRQAGAMNARRRVTGALGSPDDALAWLSDRMAMRSRQHADCIPMGLFLPALDIAPVEIPQESMPEESAQLQLIE